MLRPADLGLYHILSEQSDMTRVGLARIRIFLPDHLGILLAGYAMDRLALQLLAGVRLACAFRVCARIPAWVAV